MTKQPAPVVGVPLKVAQAAVHRLARSAPRQADAVSLPLAWMAGGQGVIRQAGLQDFLWTNMPAMMMPDEWPDILVGLALLFDDVGHGHYADVVRSRSTLEVLDSYENGRGPTGLVVARARKASGVHVGNTDEFTWTSSKEGSEALAHQLVEEALELAVVSGELQVGTPGWTSRAKDLNHLILTTPHEQLLGQSPQSLVYSERIADWIGDVGNEATRLARSAFGTPFLTPIEPPADLVAAIAPIHAVLERAEPGVRFQADVAAEIGAELGWRGAPVEGDMMVAVSVETEAMVARLADNARRLGWLRRDGHNLKLSKKGRRMLGRPVELWRESSSMLAGYGSNANRVGETLATVLLDNAAGNVASIHGDAHDVYERCIEYSQGYPQSSFAPRFWPELLADVALDEIGLWQFLQLVEADGITLTNRGRATIGEYLRSQAVAPTYRSSASARRAELRRANGSIV